MIDNYDILGIKVKTQVTYTIGSKKYFSPVGACRSIAKSKIWSKERLAIRFGNSWGEVGCLKYGHTATEQKYDKCSSDCDRCFYLKLRERYTKLLVKAFKKINDK